MFCRFVDNIIEFLYFSLLMYICNLYKCGYAVYFFVYFLLILDKSICFADKYIQTVLLLLATNLEHIYLWVWIKQMIWCLRSFLHNGSYSSFLEKEKRFGLYSFRQYLKFLTNCIWNLFFLTLLCLFCIQMLCVLDEVFCGFIVGMYSNCQEFVFRTLDQWSLII